METTTMHEIAQAQALLDPKDATHVAVKDGAWSDPDTWAGGHVPDHHSSIHIPDEISILYDVKSSPDLAVVRVDGELTFTRAHSTEMRVETVVTMEGSHLDAGSMADPIPSGIEVEIVFRDTPIDLVADPGKLGHGLVALGEVDIQGATKESHLVIKQDVSAGASSIDIEGDLTNWQAGETILIVGTKYLGEDEYGVLMTQDETRTITKIEGSTIHFDAPLDYAHERPIGIEADIYVGNLSRNVTFRSENPEGTRGHVMLHNDTPNPEDGSVNSVRYAAFEDLGRTDKTVDISAGNPEGRYPLHLHNTGADVDAPTNMLIGNAVSGSPGWGIVQHGSRAMVNDNIVYDITGGGIVSETGNETGAWMGNLVSSVTGYKAENKNGNGDHGAAYENQSRVIVQQDNIAANSKLGWNYSGRENFPEDEVRSGAPLDGAHRKMFEREQLKFDPSPFDVAIDHEEPPIVDFTGNEVIGASEGFRVYHRQFSDDTDTMSVIGDFTIWGGKNAINLKNYSSNYEFIDSVFQGSGEGFRVERKTSAVVFNDVEFRDFGTGYRSFGVNHESFLIDVDFINVDKHFQLEDLMKNISSTGLKQELIAYYKDNYGIDYENPMPTIVNSADLTPIDRVYFVADPDADLNAADQTLNIHGKIHDSLGERTFNEYLVAKTPSGATGSKEFEGVNFRFGSYALGQQTEFELSEFVELHGTWQRADGTWVVPVVNWITDRLSGVQHPVVIEVELRGWSDDKAEAYELTAYPDPGLDHPGFDYGFDIDTRDLSPTPVAVPVEEPVEKPVEEPAEVPVEEPIEEPAEELVEEPVKDDVEPVEDKDPVPEVVVDTFWADDPGAVLGTAGNDTLRGSEGNDILVDGEGKDKLTGLGGADVFVLTANDARTGQDNEVKDFDLSEGDALAIVDVPDALTGTDPNGWMRFVKVGTVGELEVNLDGAGFELLAIFRNGRGLTVDELLSEGSLMTYFTSDAATDDPGTVAEPEPKPEPEPTPDVSADEDGDFDLSMLDLDIELGKAGAIQVQVSGLDVDARASVQISSGTTVLSQEVNSDGIVEFDLSAFGPGTFNFTALLSDASGNTESHVGETFRLSAAIGDDPEVTTGSDPISWIDVTNSGSDADDYLTGGSNNDRLVGGAGTDRIWGKDGDDILEGGAGGDKLYGGAGADIFVFDLFSVGSGKDDIKDFAADEGDAIALIGLVPEDAADLSEWVRFVDYGTTSRLQIDLTGSGSGFEDLAVIRDGRGLDLDALIATDGIEFY